MDLYKISSLTRFGIFIRGKRSDGIVVNTLEKYFFAVKDLKPMQIVYQLRRFFFRPGFRHLKTRDFSFSLPALKADFIERAVLDANHIRVFTKRLPLEDFFKPELYSSFLPLEQFTLHYMDFLMDPSFDANRSVDFTEFYERHPDSPFAFAPYPVSVRLANWLKASHRMIFDQAVLSHIEKLGRYLERNKEFHLRGNHLLKNMKALLFYYSYFRHDKESLDSEHRSLQDQLIEQILPDGWHFERTPTYHLIVLEDLLDIYNILPSALPVEMNVFLEEKIHKMLQVIHCWSDEYPLFNDSSYGSAPSLAEIRGYAELLGFGAQDPRTDSQGFPDAGYFVYFRPGFTLWIDAGDLGPGYLPAHAHNDSLSFILYVDGEPLFCDTGACSYQDRNLRDIARSVRSHNTVMIEDVEPSQFWGNFRYARKVKLHSREVREDKLCAEVTYCNKSHGRIWEIGEKRIKITDHITGGSGTAFFHLAEGCDVDLNVNRRRAVVTREKKPIAELASDNTLELSESLYCPNIHDIHRRRMLSVRFSSNHSVEIKRI